MQGSTENAVASIRRTVGRIRINDPEEKMTARFAAGTLARMKGALEPKESIAGLVRIAVERELQRRERE